MDVSMNNQKKAEAAAKSKAKPKADLALLKTEAETRRSIMATSTATETETRTFHLFPLLPAELRLKIWRMTFQTGVTWTLGRAGRRYEEILMKGKNFNMVIPLSFQRAHGPFCPCDPEPRFIMGTNDELLRDPWHHLNVRMIKIDLPTLILQTADIRAVLSTCHEARAEVLPLIPAKLEFPLRCDGKGKNAVIYCDPETDLFEVIFNLTDDMEGPEWVPIDGNPATTWPEDRWGKIPAFDRIKNLAINIEAGVNEHFALGPGKGYQALLESRADFVYTSNERLIHHALHMFAHRCAFNNLTQVYVKAGFSWECTNKKEESGLPYVCHHAHHPAVAPITAWPRYSGFADFNRFNRAVTQWDDVYGSWTNHTDFKVYVDLAWAAGARKM